MNLIDQFQQAALAAAATVQRVPRDASAIAQAVSAAAVIDGVTAPRIAVAASQDLPADLLDAVRAFPNAVTDRTKTALARTDVGVTEAFAGVATTGSVCVSVDHEYAGPISLLVRQHIAILPADRIIQRPSDLLNPQVLGGVGLTRSFVFITGPSATADMGDLVRGVHGPHHLHIILLV